MSVRDFCVCETLELNREPSFNINLHSKQINFTSESLQKTIKSIKFFSRDQKNSAKVKLGKKLGCVQNLHIFKADLILRWPKFLSFLCCGPNSTLGSLQVGQFSCISTEYMVWTWGERNMNNIFRILSFITVCEVAMCVCWSIFWRPNRFNRHKLL